MWKCPVCANENQSGNICNICGFDNCENFIFDQTIHPVPEIDLNEYKKELIPDYAELSENVKILMEKAQSGNGDAEYEIAKLYHEGDGIGQDDEEAVIWYRRAAEHGNAEAQCVLGDMYYFGDDGITEDPEEAIKWYRKAAYNGNAKAQFSLAFIYVCHFHVNQDNAAGAKAVKWYKLAANQGYVPAQINLGNMYYNGEGVRQDYKEAVRWYRLAAEQGNADGQFNLGMMYFRGEGVDTDYIEAVKWLELAAEQGHVSAQEEIECIIEQNSWICVVRPEAKDFMKRV